MCHLFIFIILYLYHESQGSTVESLMTSDQNRPVTFIPKQNLVYKSLEL